MASLHEDGDFWDLHTIQPTESPGEVTSDDTSITEEDHYSSSFVPNTAAPATDWETIQQAVQSLGQPQLSNLMWEGLLLMSFKQRAISQWHSLLCFL